MHPKNKFIRSSLVLALCAGLQLGAYADVDPDLCNKMGQALQNGKDQSNDRLSNVETSVKRQISSAGNCLETFGKTASRSLVTVGGFDFDLGSLSNILANNACNMIQQQATSISSRAISQSGLPWSAQQQVLNGVRSTLPTPAPTVYSPPIAPVQSSSPGIFDRISCYIGGSC
jgi:hypothetical protein